MKRSLKQNRRYEMDMTSGALLPKILIFSGPLILTGILQPKGRVHFQVCDVITEKDLVEYNNCTNNEYHKQVAQLIDKRILSAYKLWPNNYIAHDMLYGQRKFVSKYTCDEEEAFKAHLSKLNQYDSLKDKFCKNSKIWIIYK